MRCSRIVLFVRFRTRRPVRQRSYRTGLFRRIVHTFLLLTCRKPRKAVHFIKTTTQTQSVGAQCSMFRTVYAIRHGCRWFQTETSCANLQRPCCKLPCEFYKKKFFVKHRFCLTHPPSVAVLNKNSQSKMYKDVYF